eukprot:1160799-Pelagomonas_calceolata.AAC.2
MVICSSNDGDLLQNSKPHVRCDDDLLRAISFRAGLGSEIDVVMAFLYLDDCALIRLERTSDPKVAWKHFHLDFLGKYLVSKICLEVKYGLGSLPNGVHL